MGSEKQTDVGRGREGTKPERWGPGPLRDLTHISVEYTVVQGIPSPNPIHRQGTCQNGIVPRLVLTIRPAHGIIQHAGDTSPQGALGRVARVHAPCVVIIAPVQLVLKEISPVIVGPGEDSIDATWWEAEVGDGSRVPFLYVVVLKHPVSVSWW